MAVPLTRKERDSLKQRPSLALTKDQLFAQAEIKHQNKMDAMAEEFIVKEDGQWKNLETYWASADDTQRKNIVFGLTFNNGAKPRDVARLFDIKVEDLKQYASVMNQAVAALKLKIQGNQITSAFMVDQPVMKFFLGKQFGEQVENPAHDTVASIDEGAGAITISVLTKSVDASTDQTTSFIATDARGVSEVLQ